MGFTRQPTRQTQNASVLTLESGGGCQKPCRRFGRKPAPMVHLQYQFAEKGGGGSRYVSTNVVICTHAERGTLELWMHMRRETGGLLL